MLPVLILRSCAGCGGHWAGHNSPSYGGDYRCRACRRKLVKGFDPQRGDHVRWVESHYGGRDGEWQVLARDGDKVTIRRLGRPDTDPIVVLVVFLYRSVLP